MWGYPNYFLNSYWWKNCVGKMIKSCALQLSDAIVLRDFVVWVARGSISKYVKIKKIPF